MVRIMMVFRLITVLAISYICGSGGHMYGQSDKGITVSVLCSCTKFHIIYIVFSIISSLLIKLSTCNNSNPRLSLIISLYVTKRNFLLFPSSCTVRNGYWCIWNAVLVERSKKKGFLIWQINLLSQEREMREDAGVDRIIYLTLHLRTDAKKQIRMDEESNTIFVSFQPKLSWRYEFLWKWWCAAFSRVRIEDIIWNEHKLNRAHICDIRV